MAVAAVAVAAVAAVAAAARPKRRRRVVEGRIWALTCSIKQESLRRRGFRLVGVRTPTTQDIILECVYNNRLVVVFYNYI